MHPALLPHLRAEAALIASPRGKDRRIGGIHGCPLDIYNREWFAQQLGTATVERDGQRITTTRSREGERWRVEIDYGPDVPPDTFDWQLYTAAEMSALTERIGFRPLVHCTWADEAHPITPDDARMQFVFEKA